MTDEIVQEGHVGEENLLNLDMYAHEPHLRDLPFSLLTLPRWVLLVLIRFYQMTIAQTLPANTCRFYPSCSHYGYQAIYIHGSIKGLLMAIWRVLRCNPFNSGGYDPVPIVQEKNESKSNERYATNK